MPLNNFNHFRGKSGSKCKRKHKSTRKQRHLNRGTKRNKYATQISK
jgi:hypothetical protein